MYELCYDGALVMPSNFAVISEEEMTYVDGGRAYTIRGTAKTLKNLAASLMANWFALAAGYAYSGVVTVATIVGIPASYLFYIGAGYCTFAANEYRQAYNYFSQQSSNERCKMTTVSFCGFVTGVGYDVV